MAKNIIRIATRQSPLALWQAEHVANRLSAAYPELTTELVTMVTRGDKLLDAPLAKVGGKGLFVKELEQGILNNIADIAVHSMKDVPVEFPEGLYLPIILDREDPHDAFVSNHYQSLDDLPSNARIGTSSLRRQCQIKERLPNAQILSLRGNVNTRLAKLDAGEYDAIILAAAGLKRLDMGHRITQLLDYQQSLPAIGQGAIGIECRIDDDNILQYLAILHDPNTNIRIRAERAMNAALQGGCQVPIAGFAQIHHERLFLQGLVGKPDGSLIYRAEAESSIDHPEQLGELVAAQLLAQGAQQILAELLM